MSIPRRLYAAVIVVVTLAVAGCGEAGNTSDTYVLSVTASRGGGAGNIDITLRDEVAIAVLASVAATPTPAGVSYTGTLDFSSPGTTSVVVTGLAMGAGETMTTTITYTDNSYDPPVSRTISNETVTFTPGGGPDLTYTKLLVLPIE